MQPSTSTLNAIGANGILLEIFKQMSVPVVLGSSFQTEHSLAVAKGLPVDCLLGADFLILHSAVLDCANQCLSLGNHMRYRIPLWGQSLPDQTFVVVPKNGNPSMSHGNNEFQGRRKHLITGAAGVGVV